jgi:hypothetical protein
MPTTGIGRAIESHPACATAAARPIQTPMMAASVTLAAHQRGRDDQADEIEHFSGRKTEVRTVG